MTETAGVTAEEAQELGLVRGKFYFIGGAATKTLFMTKLVQLDPLLFQYYRSKEPIEKKSGRFFVPVWWDDRQNLEDWAELEVRAIYSDT